jgi:hypothetical protein
MSQADLPIGMRQHTFTETTPDATLHFQILDIGRQIYVWMSTGTTSLSQLAFGIQTQVVSNGSRCQKQHHPVLRLGHSLTQ